MKRFDCVVCYDVNTTELEGKRRLRRVAKACEGHGVRVQNSVFECRLTPVIYQKLIGRLLEIIDLSEDSLRIYFLKGDRESFVTVYGRDTWRDFESPLVL